MLRKAGKVGAALAGLAALAVGGSAVAGAASDKGSANGSGQPARQGQASPGYGQAPPGYGQPPAGQPGPAGRPAHKPETPLTGTTAEKVREAALAKVEGGSIIRVETDSDHGSPYEAHVRKADGTEVEVLVNKQFEVTAVNSFGPHR
jgi:hypothetical protein